jgi:hypothetical protein
MFRNNTAAHIKKCPVSGAFVVFKVTERLVEDRGFDAEDLVQLRRGRRVLHVDLLVREDVRRGAEGGQRASWKPDRISFFLPG